MRSWPSGGEQGTHGVQVVERVRRKAAVYGQDITSSSSAPGLKNGDSADGALPAGCMFFSSRHRIPTWMHFIFSLLLRGEALPLFL